MSLAQGDGPLVCQPTTNSTLIALEKSTLIELTCETLVYGSTTAVILLSLYTLLISGTRRGSYLMLTLMALFMYLLSTAHWVSTLAVMVMQLKNLDPGRWVDIRNLCYALVLLNVLLADGIVVWRMHALCAGHVSPRVLSLPSGMLVLTSVCTFTTIGLRSGAIATRGKIKLLETYINVFQVTNKVMSLVTNVAATGVIAFWAWRFRQQFTNNVTSLKSVNLRVARVLVLVAESGGIFCISSMFMLASSWLGLETKKLSDLYTPVHSLIACMYPMLVALLVNTQSTAEAMLCSQPLAGDSANADTLDTLPLTNTFELGYSSSLGTMSTCDSEKQESPVLQTCTPQQDLGLSRVYVENDRQQSGDVFGGHHNL
ncbi:hypothetical protein BDW22DRAFT_797072 [Trametopsis cervina]|nr:hypothetical protein BDW22DRAFT_797072 [Trametopsis cervina]